MKTHQIFTYTTIRCMCKHTHFISAGFNWIWKVIYVTKKWIVFLSTSFLIRTITFHGHICRRWETDNVCLRQYRYKFSSLIITLPPPNVKSFATYANIFVLGKTKSLSFVWVFVNITYMKSIHKMTNITIQTEMVLRSTYGIIFHSFVWLYYGFNVKIHKHACVFIHVSLEVFFRFQ